MTDHKLKAKLKGELISDILDISKSLFMEVATSVMKLNGTAH